MTAQSAAISFGFAMDIDGTFALVYRDWTGLRVTHTRVDQRLSGIYRAFGSYLHIIWTRALGAS